MLSVPSPQPSPPAVPNPTVREKAGALRLDRRRISDNFQKMDYHNIITLESGKRSGKPCIRGTRMTVTDVLEYLASGMSHAELLAEFPDLTEEDIRACLAFAADRERKLAALPA